MCESCKALEERVYALESTLARLGAALGVQAASKLARPPATGLPTNWPASYPKPGGDVVGVSRVAAWCKGFRASQEGKKPRDNPYDWNSRGHKQAWEKGWMAGSGHSAQKGAA